MKHKHFKHLFTALLLLCSTVVTAHDFEVDGIYYNIADATNKTVAVTFKGSSYNEYSNEYTGDVVILKSVTYNGTTYSVKSIGERAFYGCSDLTSIIIPNSVTSIGYYAFYNCSGLTSVEFGNSVTSIGYEAFAYCRGLTSVEIPNSVTSIGNSAFWGCYGLASIVVDGNNTTYDSRENCNAIILTKTNTLIQGCNNTVIPNSVTSIGYEAFGYCTGLTSIEIPNSVTSIGGYAFYGCSGLASIVIPNSVTFIGNWAFYNCSGLTSVDIPNSVTSIGEVAFYNTAWYNNQPDGVVYAGNILYKYKGTMPANTSIVIKEGTTTIGVNAFYSCLNLTSIEIPNSVTSIGDYAFGFCSGLTSIVIGNSVTSIGERAFFYCSGLTSITSLIPADALFAVYSHTFYFVNKNSCTLYVPNGAKETYASTAGWNELSNIIELGKPITEVTVTINQYGNATYCSEFALDFSNVDDLKAYAATGYKSNSQVVTLTRVQTAEAGVGLFLKGEPGEYVVPVIESTDEHSLNLLVGTLEQTVVNSTEGAMSNYKFTILPGDETPMFYPFEDNTTLSAGKAYLQIPTAWLPATAQKSLSIRFDDGTTTDIDEVFDEVEGQSGKVKGVCYDMQGRVVENPTTGIYIIDGKKVLIK